MIIAKINSGLCNQMYFFSTAYALAREWDEELVIDCDIDGNQEWTYLLDEFQMPSYKKVIYPLRYYVGKEFVKIAPEIKEHAVIIDETYFEEDGGYLTIPKEKFQLEYPGKDIYLKGTFLMRQMFTKYISDLRKIFTLKEPSLFVHEFEKTIEHVTAIGVHIRKQGFAVLGDDNGMDFFMAAIVYMRKRYDNARFYIFSDELDYAKESLGSADDIFYIDAINGYRGDIEEFVCLTKCHHYILTRRSTYGRMAEILNPDEKKVSVLFGGNTWNDSEERFHFMSQEEVQELSKLFKKTEVAYNFQESCFWDKSDEEMEQIFIHIGLNSERITIEDRKKILYQKARLYTRKKEYGQAVHLCRLLEEQHKQDDADFHEFFGSLLYRYGATREAITEYIKASGGKEITKNIFEDNIFCNYKKLFKQKEKKHYILVQYGSYTSQYVSEIQVLGLILARMGNCVSFIFKRTSLEVQEGMLNASMIKWNENVDNKWLDLMLKNGFALGRFYYEYPCYEYAEIINGKKENLQSIADKYPKEETIIIGRDPEIFTADIPFRKVFVDFSAPFDEAYLLEEVKESIVNRMYEYADIVVTRNMGYRNSSQKVIHIDETLLDKYQENVKAEVPYYGPTIYTDDYLDIALKIALSCS